jgi:polyisoprenoid-binding protein YceI
MSTTTTETKTWVLDPVHSSIGFEVDYAGGTFRGSFREASARFDGQALAGSAKVASVDVKDENLNAHLQSPDFFDAERHPELSFESSEIERNGDAVTVRGVITIRGEQRPVELTGTINDPIKDAYGNDRLGLRLETTVDRTQFGLNWNAPLPGGGDALANEVKVISELYFVPAEA